MSRWVLYCRKCKRQFAHSEIPVNAPSTLPAHLCKLIGKKPPTVVTRINSQPLLPNNAALSVRTWLIPLEPSKTTDRQFDFSSCQLVQVRGAEMPPARLRCRRHSGLQLRLCPTL